MFFLAFGGLCEFVQIGSHAKTACVLPSLWSPVYSDWVDGGIKSKQSRGDSSPLDAASNYFTPTWEMNVLGSEWADAGCSVTMFRKTCVGREEGFQEDSVTFF